MRALVALPYANPHLGLFYQWVQTRFECDFYVFGNVHDHRSYIQFEQFPLAVIDKSIAKQRAQSGEYAVVYMHGMFYPETLFLLSAKSTRLIILTEPIAPGKRSLLNRIYKKALAKRLASRHDVSLLMLGPIEATKDFEQLAGKELFSTPYGYFPNIPLRPNQKDAMQLPVQIIFAGQFIERKNIDLILKAAHLSESVRDGKCRITLVGDGPLKESVQASADIHYKGLTDRSLLPDLFCQSDILLLPSKYDGWGAVVNEAAACGCMALLSRQVMAATIFLKENETGQFIADDALLLAKQIDYLCANPAAIHSMKTGMQKQYTALLQSHDNVLENHYTHATTTAYL